MEILFALMALVILVGIGVLIVTRNEDSLPFDDGITEMPRFKLTDKDGLPYLEVEGKK